MDEDYRLNHPAGGITADDNAIRREEIDVSNLLYPSSSNNQVDSPQADLESYLNRNPPAGESLCPRQRRKFAKLPLAATKEFFLLDDKKYLYDGVDLGIIKGQIETCASAKNGQRYRVAWYPTEECVKPLGQLEVSHLRQYYSKSSDMMDQLQLLNQEYVSKFGTESVVPSKKRKASQTSAGPLDGESAASNEMRTPERHQKAADLRTSASIFTSSNSTSTKSVVTRGSDTDFIESASEDGDDLDERDNSWRLVDEPVFPDSDDELDERPVVDPNSQGFTNLLKNLAWKFDLIQPNEDVFTACPEATPNPLYDGPHGLRRGVANTFSTPTECFQLVGGFDHRYVAALVAGTNNYYRDFIKPRLGYNEHWNGSKWRPVMISEMYKFLGILLRISIMPLDAGGYYAYFSSADKHLSMGFGRYRKEMTIPNTAGFALKYMMLSRFKQIRGAFHPENREQGFGGDKCYQLRRAINRLNAASCKSFIPGRNLSFDEGGVSCRSRFCPVRQYNKDKPDKFRVDFFILSGANTYEILHIDVYQGRNSSNASIHESARALPTTQKAVVNALIQTSIDIPSSHGMRHLFMDNRYQCPELAVLCRDKLSVYTTGTTRAKRKGWDASLMTMKNGCARGSTILAFDKVNKILLSQWNDSKVVKSCSSYIDTSLTEVYRQVGPQKMSVKCLQMMKNYQQNMFGVDKGDQLRAAGGGFANKAHFKKWYKRTLMAIFDCMLLNSLIAWRMSLKEVSGRKDFERYDFLWWISEDFLNYEDQVQTKPATDVANNGVPKVSSMKPCDDRCDVCMFESKFVGDKVGLKVGVAKCPCCNMSLHVFRTEDERHLLQKQPEFLGMSCHEMAHSDIGRQIWEVNEGGGVTGKRAYELKRNHDILNRIKQIWEGASSVVANRAANQGGTAQVSPEEGKRSEEGGLLLVDRDDDDAIGESIPL